MIVTEKLNDTELPRFVQIEPVGQCNLRCRMCPVVYREDGGPGRAPAFMSYELFCRLLDEFHTATELQLQGMGEPMLHPRFFDMVRYAADKGIEVSANSNLTALSPRRADDCARSGLRRLHVSLDAADPEAYEYIRVGSRFERVLRNLRLLNEAKRRSASELPEIHLVVVVMRRNLEELPGLVRLAAGQGIAEVSVQHLCHDFSESSLPPRYLPMRAFVDAQTLLFEDPARIDHWFGKARALAGELGVQLRLPRTRPRPHAASRRGRARCDWPWRGAYVSYAGDAMPCCMIATPDRMNLGNMGREGVVRIWNSAQYREFRERLDSDDPPEICRGCAVYHGTF